MLHDLVHNPWFVIFVGWFFFSNIVSTMPAPDPKDGKGYQWLYGAMHAIAANAKTVWSVARNSGFKLPGGPVDPQS